MTGFPARSLLLFALSVVPHLAHAAVPAGFQDSLVATVAGPTALAFTPDGRLLITTQAGRLWIYQGDALLPGPALDLGARSLQQQRARAARRRRGPGVHHEQVHLPLLHLQEVRRL